MEKKFGKQNFLNLSFRIAYLIKKIHKNPLSGSINSERTNARTESHADVFEAWLSNPEKNSDRDRD